MTNDEKINKMTGYQKVDLIKIINQGPICHFCAYDAVECHTSNVDCDEGIKKWLDSKAIDNG